MLAATSYADVEEMEPALPERHEVKRPPKTEVRRPPEVLTNPDLPERRGIKPLEALPGFKVHSAGRVAEQFDSNVFLADTDTRFDFITILAPSVGFEMKAGDSMLSADYEIVQNLFGIWQSQNHLDQRVRAMGEAQLNDFKITAKDDFRIFTDRAANENSQRLEEVTNDFKGAVSAQFDKLTVDVGYINKIRTYASDDLSIGQLTWGQRDYMDESAYLTVSYRYWPKTYVIFENDVGHIRYYETSELPDSLYFDSLAGLRGEWTNKITVNLRGGIRYQHYDQSDVISSKRYLGPVVRGGVEYRPTKDDKAILSLGITNYESIYSTNNYFTMYFAGLEYRHEFSRKFSCGAFANYQLHLYPCQTTDNGVTAKRYDNQPALGANIRYDMNRWISAEVKYEYRQKASNFDIYDYKDNIVTVSATGGF